MTGDTIIFRKGSSFEYMGQFQTDLGVPEPLTGITPSISETKGAGMQDLVISVLDSVQGKFFLQLPEVEASKLPLGRSSWFKIQFAWDGSPTVLVFAPIWLDTR